MNSFKVSFSKVLRFIAILFIITNVICNLDNNTESKQSEKEYAVMSPMEVIHEYKENFISADLDALLETLIKDEFKFAAENGQYSIDSDEIFNMPCFKLKSNIKELRFSQFSQRLIKEFISSLLKTYENQEKKYVDRRNIFNYKSKSINPISNICTHYLLISRLRRSILKEDIFDFY